MKIFHQHWGEGSERTCHAQRTPSGQLRRSGQDCAAQRREIRSVVTALPAHRPAILQIQLLIEVEQQCYRTRWKGPRSLHSRAPSVARCSQGPFPDIRHISTPTCFCRSPNGVAQELMSVKSSLALQMNDEPGSKLGRGPHVVAGAAHWPLRGQQAMTGLSPCCWVECTRAPGRGPTRSH